MLQEAGEGRVVPGYPEAASLDGCPALPAPSLGQEVGDPGTEASGVFLYQIPEV